MFSAGCQVPVARLVADEEEVDGVDCWVVAPARPDVVFWYVGFMMTPAIWGKRREERVLTDPENAGEVRHSVAPYFGSDFGREFWE